MAAKTENKKKPNPIDIHVGSRIRLKRNYAGMSQTELGDQLGITFQQIQKYEKGANRVGASRLQEISRILGAPVEFFFEGAPRSGDEATSEKVDTAVNSLNDHMDFIATSEGIKLIRSYSSIKNSKVRAKALELIKALADAEKH